MRLNRFLLSVFLCIAMFSQAQTWDSIVCSQYMAARNTTLYSANHGLIIGSFRGIWRIKNHSIDTLLYSISMVDYSRLALSNDTVFYNNNGLKFFKIGQVPSAYSLPNVHDSIFTVVSKVLIKNYHHYYQTDYGIYHYDGVTTTLVPQSQNSARYMMTIDNNNKLYFLAQNKLYAKNFSQTVLITDTLTRLKKMEVNPHTNELYLINHGKLYRYNGNTMSEIIINNHLAENYNHFDSIIDMSFAEDRNFMYLRCQAGDFNNKYYQIGVESSGGISRLITKDDKILNAVKISEFEGDIYAYQPSKIFYASNELSNPFINSSGYGIINKGNYRASIASNGMFFLNSQIHVSMYEAPKNSGRGLAGASSLWFMGINESNDTSLAVAKYEQIGKDFWAGPKANLYDLEYDNKYKQVWVLGSEEVDFHRNNFQNPNYVIPESILKWPAHGNISNGEYAFLAPFVDVNQNGYYEPNLGDYPIIFGVQTAFFMYNDARDYHTESGGQPLNVEVHGMAYVADSVDNDLKNSLFVRYNIFNKGDDFTDFIVGRFEDLDIEGCYSDYVGCDTLRDTYFFYKGLLMDCPLAPPYVSVSFLSEKLNKFIYFNGGNYVPSIAEPLYYSDYIWVMKGMKKNGQPYTYGGDASSGTEPVDYVFPGNPMVQEEWSEVSAQNFTGDRKALALAQNKRFNNNSNYCLDLVYTYYGENNVFCDTILANYPGLIDRVDVMKNYYNTSNVDCFSTASIFYQTPIPSGVNVTYSNAYVYTTDIDYSLKIDSVKILQKVPINTYLTSITWGVYQNGNQFVFSDVEYSVQNNIPVVLSLNLMKNPNLKSINSHSILFYLHGIVGVSEFQKQSFKLYPNPASTKINVEGVESVSTIFIYDVMGRNVRIVDNKTQNKTISIVIDDLNKGIYLVRFTNEFGIEIGLEKLLIY
jgi:hypothetical protein